MTTPAKSSHGASSSAGHHAPTAEKAVPTPPVAKTVEKTDSTPSAPTAPDNETVPSDGKQFAFALILTIVVVFPLAMGIGSVLVKGSTSARERQAAHDEEVRLQAEEEPAPPKRLDDRKVGDAYFEERKYEAALDYYRQLGGTDPARLPPELAYRIALCQESLGRWEEALEGYRVVGQTTDDTIQDAIASSSQARVLIRLGQTNAAAQLLRTVLQRHTTGLPGKLVQEIEFLIPLTQVQGLIAAQRRSIGHDEFPMTEDEIDWPLDLTLFWIDSKESPVVPSADAAIAEADAVTPENVAVIKINKPVATIANSPDWENWKCDLTTSDESLRDILGRLATACDWTLDLSDIPNSRALDRHLDVTTRDIPLCLLLSNLAAELKSTWSVTEKRLSLHRLDPADERTWRMIARTLTAMLNAAPNNRMVRHARFALAELDQLNGNYREAADKFSALVDRTATPFSIRSAFNAGSNYRRLDDFKLAIARFEKVVSGAPHGPLLSQGLLQYGRLLLDTGDLQEAVFQFRRATEFHNLPAERARGVALLGLSLLAQNKFYEASESIFLNRALLEDPTARNGAAFVTAFARWNALQGERKEREATYLYRALVAVKPECDWMGLTGKVLVGRAFADLGFDDQVQEVYNEIPRNNLPEGIRHMIDFTLAERLFRIGEKSQAEDAWRKLSMETEDLWTNRARLKLVEQSFADGKLDESLTASRSLLNRVGITPDEVKTLMGRIYEAMGDNKRAAKSYAGQIPTP